MQILTTCIHTDKSIKHKDMLYNFIVHAVAPDMWVHGFYLVMKGDL